MDEIRQLENAIMALEAQRSLLGEAVVETALSPMREKLATLRARQSIEERRLVTVLFADLVGFTAMSEHMDPEDVREILNTYLARWAACIEEHAGVVEKFIGDAVMAVYGLTRAQEDDAQRAISTAIQMLAELDQLNSTFWHTYHLRLAVRIGVHTGPVVVSTLGERTGHDFVAVGDTVNLASRLQSAAPENGILISHDTYRHVQGSFDIHPLDPVRVKGKDQLVRVYQVLASRQLHQRTSSRGIDGVTAVLVGRQPELAELRRIYQQVISTQQAWIVLLSGDPGVGKSRLLLEFESGLTDQPVRMKAAAFEPSAATPYWLLRQIISNWCGILESDPLDQARLKLESCLDAHLNQDAQLKAHFIGALLGIDFSNSPYLHGIGDDYRQLRERGLHYLGQLFASLASCRPVIVSLDDIHWADAPSLHAIQFIAKACSQTPILFICLSRLRLGEIHPDWMDSLNLGSFASTHINLQPLTSDESASLFSQVFHGAPALPVDLAQRVVAAAEGNPFYLEEIIKMLLEENVIILDSQSGTWQADMQRIDSWKVPPTLTAVLQARLDSLPPTERETLQQAAVIGRTFWDTLLQSLQNTSLPPAASLSLLQRRAMVDLQPISAFAGGREFRFHHALMQEVVYGTILKKKRLGLHRKVASWLVQAVEQSGRAREMASQIAHHFALAGEGLLAARWLYQAGVHARSQGALVEARRFLDQALGLTMDTEPALRWEILLEHDRLLGELGDLPARQADETELLVLARQLGGDQPLAIVSLQQATTLNYMGDYAGAVQALDRAIHSAQACRDRAVEVSAKSFKIACLSRLSAFEQAGSLVTDTLIAAEQLGDEIQLARTLTDISMYYSLLGDRTRALKTLDQQIAICRRLGNLTGEIIGSTNLGYEYIQIGLYPQSIELLQRALHLAEGIGARRQCAYAALNLGLVYQRTASLSPARQLLEETTADLQTLGDHFGLASGISYLALVYESAGDMDAAMDMYSKAVELFQQIEQPGNVADAQAGLARCWLQLGNHLQASQLALNIWNYLFNGGSRLLEFPMDAYLACSDVFEACGQTDQAVDVLRTAAHELSSRAAQIHDPLWRQAFLENVPAHREILARMHAA